LCIATQALSHCVALFSTILTTIFFIRSVTQIGVARSIAFFCASDERLKNYFLFGKNWM
jgi:hypothetical protein